jgi:adenylate cyclase
MGLEIERKFLVVGDGWRALAKRGRHIRQGYLCTNPMVVRVRLLDRNAFLTVKDDRPGLVRAEFDYSIPLHDAEQMLAQHCDTQTLIEKTRYEIDLEGVTWEIDVFGAQHAGLVLAEVELYATDQSLRLPDWIGREVTDDPNFRNHKLGSA